MRRDPVEDVVHRSAKVNRGVESNTASFEGITMEELNARWTAVVVDLLKEGINVTNPDHAMEGALSIRYDVALTAVEIQIIIKLYYVCYIFYAYALHMFETRCYPNHRQA